MPRKSAADIIGSEVAEALEVFEDVTFVRWDAAMDTYNAQDVPTQHTIDKIVAALATYATGEAVLAGKKITIDAEMLDKYLIWLAVEIVKDLAIMGVKVTEFEFPASMCASCGAEISG